MLPAILLVGGLGTRLRALYPDRPKALVPVRGRPFLEWMIGWLRAQGVTRIHLAAGYRAQQILDWAASRLGDGLSVSCEETPLGTGGGLRFALDHVPGDEILALNGDSFLPALELAAWLREPLSPDLDGEIAITRIDAPGRYGTVEFDPATRRILAFLEKADRPAGWVNGGVYRLRRAALEARPAGVPFSMETDFFPTLSAAGRLRARPVDPPLLDMGTPDGLQTLERWMAAHPERFHAR